MNDHHKDLLKQVCAMNDPSAVLAAIAEHYYRTADTCDDFPEIARLYHSCAIHINRAGDTCYERERDYDRTIRS